MKAGDRLLTALWYNPEREGEYSRAREGVAEGLKLTAENEGFLIGPVSYEETGPGDARLPDPPNWMNHGVRALIGEAEIVCRTPSLVVPRFIADLDAKDLERLRAITRKAHAKRYPGRTLSDAACDAIIEELGPEAAIDVVRKAVDALHCPKMRANH